MTQLINDTLPSANHKTTTAPNVPRKVEGPLGLLLRAILPIGLLAVGVVAYSYLSVEQEKEQVPPAEPELIRTKIAELRVHNYPVVITTNGIIQPHNEVVLSAEVNGLVTKINPAFEAGSYFAAGDVLVEIDSRDYETSIAIAEAQHLGATSALELAKQTYERRLRLYNKQGLSEAEVTAAQAARDQAAAQADAAQAQVDQAKRDLERTRIVAPFDGRVRVKSVGIGQSVSVGAPLGVVFAVDFAEVRLPIAARELKYLDLPEFAADEPVEVTLRDAIDTDKNIIWNAKIVRTEGALDVNSLELFAIARVDDPFGRVSGKAPLRIGQPVKASIVGKTLNDVVAIPRAAVRQLNQVYFVDKKTMTLSGKKVDWLWSDAEHLIVRDPTIPDGQWLATTQIVYAPDGAEVERIEDIALTATAENSSVSNSKTKPVAN